METSNIRAFRKMLRRFERSLDVQLIDCCSGVTLAQCHCLLEIEDSGQTTIGMLANDLGLDKSTLSRTVDGLVNLGLVERTPDPTDRRFMILTLTREGKKTCDELNATSDMYYERVFQRIPEKHHSGIFKYFGLLVQAMSDAECQPEETDNCCN